ncbi:MAG: PD-(D/E)XK nuclease family protein [Bacteroidales bacterium]|jgi:CRISPR/Cas system-associated exonuclease Cas4 (RecB family)|nr:PD-(D/E)XK nuclease family protein [Bacteroidales bacterium]
MKPFLQRLAEQIAARYGEDPGQVCVVLPNRRAGLYLKKYLAGTLAKTAWAPQTYSVEDFITSVSGLQIIDPAGLLFEFYQIHKEVHGDKAQDFDVFAEWGQVLLKDFDEIDRHLVDPEKIFTFLDAARAYSVWNLNERPLTDQEKHYIEFYRSFLTYYRRLNTALTSKKTVYQGFAYRTVAVNIERFSGDFRWNKIFFAGLNALSGSEEKIIDYLVHTGQAEIFWDADDYYIKDTSQEAGDFIRKYMTKWPSGPVKWIEDNFRMTDKAIHVFGIPGSMGQARKAGQIISRITMDKKEPDRTALVLADEKLLLPVLYSLPEELGPVNVTMGFPFKYTHLFHLAAILFQMQENAEKFAGQRKSQVHSFYVRDILNVLAHPYLHLFEAPVGSGQASFSSISEAIRNKNRVFLRPEEIPCFSKDAGDGHSILNECLFTIWESPLQALNRILDLLEMIRDRMIARGPSSSTSLQVDLEYLYYFSRVIRRVRTIMEDYPFIHDLKTLRKILFQVLESGRLPFSGEPLQGLQVMGILETRAIDFENIIVLSVNEGILPSGRTPNTFIPFDIKSEFGLPTYQQNDAVFAYHFYRMLQRARQIYLIYDTEGDQMKGGEKSRFITQLGYELKKFNPGIIFTEKLSGPDSPATVRNIPISKAKTPEIMSRLDARCIKGFSPSALNLYIRCPLQFYFQEILGLSEAETIEETIESRTMGTVIHQVLQKTYEPFSGKYVDPELLLNRTRETEHYLQQAFSQHYQEGDLEHGKNHLINKVSLYLVNQVIRQEVAELKARSDPGNSLKIISLEQSFESILSLNDQGNDRKVRIKGKTDRIDLLEDTIRIIDYKTGSVQSSELKLISWDKLTGDPKMGKAFQLLVYAYLFTKNNQDNRYRLQTGNITLRKISEGFKMVRLPGDHEIDNESMRIFEDVLKSLLEEILNPAIPFEQTKNADNCTYCPFTRVCTR